MSGGASCALPPVPLLSPPTCPYTVPSHLSLCCPLPPAPALSPPTCPWSSPGSRRVGVCVCSSACLGELRRDNPLHFHPCAPGCRSQAEHRLGDFGGKDAAFQDWLGDWSQAEEPGGWVPGTRIHRFQSHRANPAFKRPAQGSVLALWPAVRAQGPGSAPGHRRACVSVRVGVSACAQS